MKALLITANIEIDQMKTEIHIFLYTRIKKVISISILYYFTSATNKKITSLRAACKVCFWVYLQVSVYYFN